MPQMLRALAALALGATAVAVSAQTPGTYSGTTAQGQPIVVTVSNGRSGAEVTSIQASYLLTCETSPNQVSLSSAVSGFFPIDSNGSFNASYLWDRDWFETSGQFADNGTLSGASAWGMAAVTRSASHLAEVCKSAALAYSARTGAAAAAATVRAPDLIIERQLDRDGRVIRETVRRGR